MQAGQEVSARPTNRKRGPPPRRFSTCYEVDDGGCWLWTAAVGKNGYGHRQSDGAHRVSYRMHRGAIPGGMQVLHHCDVPRCVNPDHLFLGTIADNMRDKILKGRHVSRGPGKSYRASPLKGVPRPGRIASKLSPDDVRAIRAADPSVSHQTLADTFGVSHSTIRHARRMHSWRRI